MLTRPLRFAMVTTFYPPYCMDNDGYDVQRWARALAVRGHQVDVIHDTDAYRILTGRVPEISSEDDNIRVHRLRSQTKFWSSLGVQQLGRPTTHMDRLRELLVGRYDVIHYHNISLIGGPGLWGVGTGIKLHTAHDFWLVCASHTLWRNNKELCDSKRCFRCVVSQGRPPQLWRFSGKLRQMSKHVDAFLAPSHSAKEIHSAFGFEAPIKVVPTISAVSAPRLKTALDATQSERPFFLFAGRLEDIQGLDDVISNFPDDVEAELRVVGIGTDEARLRQLAHGKRNIVFLGPKTDESIRKLRREALAVIAPQKGYEVFPNTILEAFRAGKPVLARDVGPHRDILSKSGGGLLFDSPHEIAGKLERLCGESSEASEMGRKGFAYFAANWREDVSVDAYFDVIRDVAQKKGLTDLISKIDEAPSRFEGKVPS